MGEGEREREGERGREGEWGDREREYLVFKLGSVVQRCYWAREPD